MNCYMFRAYDARGKPKKKYRSVVCIQEALDASDLVSMFNRYWNGERNMPPGVNAVRAKNIPLAKCEKLQRMGWINMTTV